MQENVFSLIGKFLGIAKRDDVTIDLYFNDCEHRITNEWLVMHQCTHWEITPDGVRTVTGPNAKVLSKRILNAELVEKAILPGAYQWEVVVKYQKA